MKNLKNSENIIDRYLYRCSDGIDLDKDGLLKVDYLESGKKLIKFNELPEYAGGIIIAEAGMGKTTFVRQLHKKIFKNALLLELELFREDPDGLGTEIDIFFKASDSQDNKIMILDGLDEATDLIGVIIRKIKNKSQVTVWITSRAIPEIESIKNNLGLDLYSISPFSRADIACIAEKDKIDADDFLEIAIQGGFISMCAKPLGYELLRELFKNGDLKNLKQSEVWYRGMQRLCDQVRGKTVSTTTDVVDCAAWIAICLVLSGCTTIWLHEPSYCPKNCISTSELKTEQFSLELINITLKRGIFRLVDDGCIQFYHNLFRDYFAALGFKELIQKERWEQLLFSHDKSCIPSQRAGVAIWCAVYDRDFSDKILDIQPEILLSSKEAIQTIGPSELCEALLNRADQISYEQRKMISGGLSQLVSAKTSTIIKQHLNNKDSSKTATISLSLEIAKACNCTDLSDEIANIALDQSFSIHLRVTALEIINCIGSDVCKEKFKDLLPIDSGQDSEDNLRGSVLNCLWPKHLTAEELVRYLHQPQKSNYFGSYWKFLSSKLPKSFDLSINKDNASIFLIWSLEHITKDDPFDQVGHLARSIYTYCWRWTEDSMIVDLLATGYLKSPKNFKSPFLEDKNSEFSWFLSSKDFMQNQQARFAVLNAILKLDITDEEIRNISANRYPLYSSNDIEMMLNKILKENFQKSLVKKWILCVKQVLLLTNLDQFSEQIDKLNRTYPNLIDSYQKIKEEKEKSNACSVKQRQEWEEEEAQLTLEWEKNQINVDHKIKTALQKKELLAPENFPGIAGFLDLENSQRKEIHIDLEKSPGWGKLSSEERDTLIDLASDYLFRSVIKPSGIEEFSCAIPQALTLIRNFRFNIYQTLTKEVWEKCSIELFKSAHSEYAEDFSPFFDTLSESFPDIAEKALIAVICQTKSSNAISHWGQRLTNQQAQAILQIVKDGLVDIEQSYDILNELVECDQCSLVLNYLNDFFNDNSKSLPNKQFYNHFLLVFMLDPNKYGERIFNLMKENSTWGREWIEIVIMDRRNYLSAALFNCSSKIIGDFYMWLHKEYSASTEPDHQGVYEPRPIDKIHELKRNLIVFLKENGIENSAEDIQTRFPQDVWLKNCIIDARIKEQEKKICIFTVNEIKSLCDESNKNKFIVKSIQHLMGSIQKALEDYQIYLQGDTPAIPDLWDTRDDCIRPKKEEDFSNHLKRYLDSKLNGMMINREVQLSTKLWDSGKPGKRVDLLVQAIDKDKQMFTLCIEVKCNWNKDAKSALKKQLIDRYLLGGTAQAGILLLGWYACDRWDNKDSRKKASTESWKDIENAKMDLQEQCQKEVDSLVSSVVIDCILP